MGGYIRPFAFQLKWLNKNNSNNNEKKKSEIDRENERERGREREKSIRRRDFNTHCRKIKQ